MAAEERDELHTTREESTEILNYVEESPSKRFSRVRLKIDRQGTRPRRLQKSLLGLRP
jgi:hypothetical protein